MKHATRECSWCTVQKCINNNVNQFTIETKLESVTLKKIFLYILNTFMYWIYTFIRNSVKAQNVDIKYIYKIHQGGIFTWAWIYVKFTNNAPQLTNKRTFCTGWNPDIKNIKMLPERFLQNKTYWNSIFLNSCEITSKKCHLFPLQISHPWRICYVSDVKFQLCMNSIIQWNQIMLPFPKL